MLRRRTPPSSAAGYDTSKRVLDVVLATAAVVATAPLALVVALVVGAETRGPVIFRHTRIGTGGRPFTCLKFRTMFAGSSDDGHREFMRAHIAGQTSPAVDPRSGEVVYRIVGDDRVTPFGRFLRRSSLDEWPQLWNVIRGDMSLVGPRPPLPYEVECYRSEHLVRLTVRPGLTGLWQISTWDQATFAEMVEADRRYIEQRSLRLDIEILLKTVLVLPRRWART